MSSSIELSSGIIIDTERDQAYVMAPDGGVMAVALSNGETIWHSNEAERPLLLSDDLLIGQSGYGEGSAGVTIRMLRVEDAGGVASEGVVPLPGGVDPLIEPTANRGFNLTAEALDGDAVLRWEFRERPLRGLATGPEEILPEEVLPETEAALSPAGAPQPGSEAFTGEEVEETVIHGQVRLTPSDGAVMPMVEASVEHALPGVPQFHAKRIDVAPSQLETAALPEDPLVFQSADGAHVLRSAPMDEAGDLWTKYKWHVFDSGSSEALGTIDLHVSFAPFVVAQGRVVVELQPYSHLEGGELIDEPMQLRAYDLNSGERVWSIPVRDIYAVPAPPH